MTNYALFPPGKTPINNSTAKLQLLRNPVLMKLHLIFYLGETRI